MIIIRVCQRTTHVPVPEANHYTGSSGMLAAAMTSSSTAGSDFTSGYAIDSMAGSIDTTFDSGTGKQAVMESSSSVGMVEDLTFDATESQASSSTGSIG